MISSLVLGHAGRLRTDSTQFPAPSLMLSCCCVALYYLVCYLYCTVLLSRYPLDA